jgi:hypothetical protein
MKRTLRFASTFVLLSLIAVFIEYSTRQKVLASNESCPNTFLDRPAAEIKFIELQFAKPPLVKLYFDVLLRNDRSGPRWFLLPGNLGPNQSPIGGKGGIDGVQVVEPQGKGYVVIGQFFGTGGFRALLLPAGAEVRLRRFPISFWGELSDKIEFEMVVAKEFKIEDRTANMWFGANSVCSDGADVEVTPSNKVKSRGSKHTTDNKESQPTIEEDERIKLQAQITKPHR